MAQGTAQEVRGRDSGSAAEAWVEVAPEELAWALGVPVGAEAPVRAADCGSLAEVPEVVVQQAVAGEGLAGEVGPEEEVGQAGGVDPAVGAEVQAAEPVVDLDQKTAQGAEQV